MAIDNPLTRASKDQKIREAIKQFPQIAARHDQLGLCAMQSFSKQIPDKFFDSEVFQNFYDWVDEPVRRDSFLSNCMQEHHRLSIAFRKRFSNGWISLADVQTNPNLPNRSEL